MKEEVVIGNIGDPSESMDLQIPDSFCKPQMLKTRGIYNTQQLQIIPINEVLNCNGSVRQIMPFHLPCKVKVTLLISE